RRRELLALEKSAVDICADEGSEFYVDSDVLMKAYKEQDRLERITDGEQSSTSESTSVSGGMSIESDRSFKLFNR
ncbi:hypothetical protein E2562_021464, partial [Oryza meyeriana var. granulata]